MHNPTTYKATFDGLIMTAFGREQTLKYRVEIEMYQARECPELWRARPALETGRHKWEATSAYSLAQILESDFVTRETDWVQWPDRIVVAPSDKRVTVVSIDRRRRA